MKKLLLSLASVALCASFANADTLYELTFNKDNNQKKITDYTSEWTVISNGTTYTISCFSNNGNGQGQVGQNEWTFVRTGSKKRTTVASIVNSNAWTESIEAVVLNAKKNNSGTNDKVTTAKLEVLASSDATSPEAVYDITSQVNALASADSDITIQIANPLPDMFYRLTFAMPINSNNGWLQVNSVKYNGVATGPILKNPNLSFPEANYVATLGEAFDAPEVVTEAEGLVYTWESSSEEVATVNSETGEITLVGDGTATITVRSAANDEYRAGEASYLLTVNDPNKTDATFDFKPQSTSGHTSFESNRIKVEFSKAEGGTAPAWYSTGTAMRLYAKNTLTISVPEGYRLVDAVFTTDTSKAEYSNFKEGTTCTNPSGATYGTLSDLKWEAGDQDGNTLVITNGGTGGHVRIQTLKVNYGIWTGIDGIEAEENAVPVYYNLQGVRVAQPESGLYIEVKGGKSRKVFVR